MSSSKSTASYVAVVALMKKVPEIRMDDQGNFFATLLVGVQNSSTSKLVEYTIFVSGDAAFRVHRYGFPNARLLLEGELCSQEGVQFVLAKKVAFLSDSGEEIFDNAHVRALVTENLLADNFYLSNKSTCENELRILH